MSVREMCERGRRRTALGSLSRQQLNQIVMMSVVITALHAVGWITLLAFVTPEHFSLGQKTLGVGVGLTAYTLGLRHAFDADHIAAIDNTTRKLMQAGQKPLSAGFWFSLGHSTIVFALALILSLGVKSLVGPVENNDSKLHEWTGAIGTSVSGTFLYLIAAINIVILVGIVKVFGDIRRGRYDEDTLERHLSDRGFMNRIFGSRMAAITRPRQMYPVGVLFGVGFDTATEVALLVLAGTSAAAGLPWYAILCLPVLFTAGMSLFDSADSVFMVTAYGWAFNRPVRKVYYNLVVTGLSIAVAFIVGTIEIFGLLAQEFDWTGAFWVWVSGIDINLLGYIIVGLFVATWVVAITVWRVGKLEDRWMPATRPSEPIE